MAELLLTEKEASTSADFVSSLYTMTGGFMQNTVEKIVPVVEKIRRLKKEKNAVILSHYYMPPELQILHQAGGVADFVGDSLGLSVEATKVKADYIVFCGVKFMAETAHVLNPSKTVLLPSHEAGCSLASSITGEDVRNLKARYPGVPVIAYVNTYAETKAECDICCTSRNALNIARSFDSQKLIFIPDMYMGQNLSKKIGEETGKELILWNGSCEVHEQFRGNIGMMAAANPEAEVLLHWEVPEETVSSTLSISSGMIGSTTDIINYVGKSKSRQFIIGSECDLGASLKGLYPEKEFITPCITCRFMKQISLHNTLAALESIGTESQKDFEIILDKDIRERAFLPIQRMIELS